MCKKWLGDGGYSPQKILEAVIDFLTGPEDGCYTLCYALQSVVCGSKDAVMKSTSRERSVSPYDVLRGT